MNELLHDLMELRVQRICNATIEEIRIRTGPTSILIWLHALFCKNECVSVFMRVNVSDGGLESSSNSYGIWPDYHTVLWEDLRRVRERQNSTPPVDFHNEILSTKNP